MRFRRYINRYKDRKQYYQTEKGSFLGVLVNYLLYGSSVNDYFMYRFYEKSPSEKKTYITCKKHKLIQRIANRSGDVKSFLDKGRFNTLFSDYIKRDWLDVSDASLADIEQFLNKHSSYYLKDKTGCEGKGVERVDDGSIDTRTMKEKWGGCLLEEAIDPCRELAEFCPRSLNTVRITVLQDQHTKDYEIMSAVLRISTGSALDNLFQGALVADIDLKTGMTATNGISRTGLEYDLHPVTQKRIKGFQIPRWSEILEMVRELDRLVPGIGYVGWDIGLSDDRGVLVIEGNDCADHDVPQLAKRRGMWPEFKKKLM